MTVIRLQRQKPKSTITNNRKHLSRIITCFSTTHQIAGALFILVSFFLFLPPPDSTNDQFQPSAYLFMSVLHLVPLCCRCISSSIMWGLGSHASGSDGISLSSFLLPGFVEPYACAHSRTHIWFPSLDNLTFVSLSPSVGINLLWVGCFVCFSVHTYTSLDVSMGRDTT